MCGLAGLFSSEALSEAELRAAAARMAGAIVHRGPDDAGTWCTATHGVAFGFRRLSIIDLSPLGHQPMASRSGRFTLMFNGEIYNFPDLRRELEGHGARFRGHSDTEIVLAAFEAWGIHKALERLIGMFAIAVWDSAERTLTLVRDRLGKKPLFVYHKPGLVTFGSELKALAAGPTFDRALDREALALYLRYLYVPAPRSIYRAVTKIPPGHLLTISDPRAPLPAATPYWSVDAAAHAGLKNPFGGSDDDAVDALDALLNDAVRSRMISDVPLGALLSGGVDSSAVVALMQEAAGRPVRTYTIGFDDPTHNEAPHARAVASHIGTDHTDLVLTGEDALAVVPRLPTMFDEPLADPSQIPTFLVSQLARQHVTVALVGDGGDELFGGYNRYAYGPRSLNRVAAFPRSVRRLAAAGINALGPGSWDRVFRPLSALPGANRYRLVGEKLHKLAAVMDAPAEAERYRSLMSAWQHPEAVLDSEDVADDTLRVLRGSWPPQLLDRMMLADQQTYLPDDLLAKVDRASMAVSLEVRAPLLDHRVVEFAWRLPASMKLRDGETKWILRQVLYRRVPRSLIDRPKTGFSVPIDAWLRGPLRGWAEDLLASLPSLPFLRAEPVTTAWRDMLARRRAAGTALWALLSFLDWQAHWKAT
jgi:asparagine synthase (glutamine-hydrolysing)